MTIDSETKSCIDKIFLDIGNKCQLLDEIGRGGQKKVYKIKRESGEIQVLKLVETTNESLERVKREIRASSIIEHSCIPKIIASNANLISDNSSMVWIIEEFIDGTSLRKILETGRLFLINDVILFLDTILSILEKSEEKKIIHRDIKPENILLDKNNNFWLIDFGIARHLDMASLTDTNSPFGPCTVGYSASEQFRNRKHDIDIRADLFSVGVVTTEMLAGYNPYTKNVDNILHVIRDIEMRPLPLLRIKGDSRYLLAQFIRTLGDNRTSRRPSSANEARELLEIIKPTLVMQKGV
jgi:serine/threonine-protein kinase